MDMSVRKFEKKKHRENDNEANNFVALVWLLTLFSGKQSHDKQTHRKYIRF